MYPYRIVTPWRQLRMYVLYTHRAVAGASVGVLVSMLLKLACETVATKVSVVIRAQNPNVVEVFVENFCSDIFCEYVYNVVQGTDLVD